MGKYPQLRDHAPPRGTAIRPALKPDSLLPLVALLQHGDAHAAEELQAYFGPMLRRALAPYRGDRLVEEDLDAVGGGILHRLFLEFDPNRGVNLFVYLRRSLPADVWSYVRQQRVSAAREVPWSSLAVEGTETDSSASRDEDALEYSIQREVGWLAQRSGVEEVTILRMAVEQALARLSTRDRELFRFWALGWEVSDIASLLGMKEKSCYTALTRVRDRLKKLLKDHIEEM